MPVSHDGGETWERTDGTRYELPITIRDAEKAWSVPQNSELINQTSMTADSSGRPYIATYWRDKNDSIPQYRLVWHKRRGVEDVESRRPKNTFLTLRGGTKMIPVSPTPDSIRRKESILYIP